MPISALLIAVMWGFFGVTPSSPMLIAFGLAMAIIGLTVFIDALRSLPPDPHRRAHRLSQSGLADACAACLCAGQRAREHAAGASACEHADKAQGTAKSGGACVCSWPFAQPCVC